MSVEAEQHSPNVIERVGATLKTLVTNPNVRNDFVFGVLSGVGAYAMGMDAGSATVFGAVVPPAFRAIRNAFTEAENHEKSARGDEGTYHIPDSTPGVAALVTAFATGKAQSGAGSSGSTDGMDKANYIAGRN